MRAMIFCLFAILLLAIPALHGYEFTKDEVSTSALDRISSVLSNK